MIRVQVRVGGAMDLLTALRRRLEAPGELLANAVPVVAGAIEKNFDAEGRPLRWPPLAPATLRRKPPGLRILERTGRLRRSISPRIEGGALLASTRVPYAAAHQRGVPGRLPARPFLALTPGDVAEVEQSVAATLADTRRGTPHQ